MHKKKTSVKKGEKSPIFNEAIIFDNVPAHALQVSLNSLILFNKKNSSNNVRFYLPKLFYQAYFFFSRLYS